MFLLHPSVTHHMGDSSKGMSKVICGHSGSQQRIDVSQGRVAIAGNAKWIPGTSDLQISPRDKFVDQAGDSHWWLWTEGAPFRRFLSGRDGNTAPPRSNPGTHVSVCICGKFTESKGKPQDSRPVSSKTS